MTWLPLAAFAPACWAATLDVTARDAGGTPLADVAVYAVPVSAGAAPRATRAIEIEQLDREFVPFVTVVQTGTLVSFPNRDPILHHVYSFSPPKAFEIKLYAGNSPTQVLFDKPGVVTLGCNIHDWMVGYVLVVDTPHFARSDAAGVARLRDLPAGAFEIRAWHPRQRAPAAAQQLTLAATASARASFVVDAAPRKPKYKPPLDRLKY